MPRILIVDDDPQILKLLSTVLQRAEHQVATARDAETAVGGNSRISAGQIDTARVPQDAELKQAVTVTRAG